MALTNPSIQLYGNMKKLVEKIRNEDSTKSDTTKNTGMMLRRSNNMNIKSTSPELEQNMKVARVLMQIEDRRNGRA